MKRWLRGRGWRCALLLACIGITAPSGADPAAVFDAVAPSVFTVVAQSSGGRSSGSAVAVGDGLLVTNHHVVRDATAVELQQGGRRYGAQVIAQAPAQDLALLEARGLGAPVPALGASEPPRVGQTVYAIGSPLGLEHSLSTGIIAAIRELQLGPMLQITAPISPGSSGGGLFDVHGRLIGLTTLQAIDGQNLNFAIPIEALSHLGLVLPDPRPAPDAIGPAPDPAPAVAAAQAPPSAAPASPAEPASPGTARPSPARLLFWMLVPLGLIAAARPAVHLLSEWWSSTPEAPSRSAADRRQLLARQLEPHRQQARRELQEAQRDPVAWMAALQKSKGDELQALQNYVEIRAQALRRLELDRKWAAAAAQGTGAARR